MTITCIIVTGTSGAGKTTLTEELRSTGRYLVLRAVTTRARRSVEDDIHYEFLADTEFSDLEASGGFLTSTTYRGARYGVRVSELVAGARSNRLLVMVVAPESVALLRERIRGANSEILPLSVFLDEEDAVLDRRLRARGMSGEDLKSQRLIDRRTAWDEDYRIFAASRSDYPRIMDALVAISDKSGILSGSRIEALAAAGLLLNDIDSQGVEGASYDLRLGDEYFYAGRVKQLSQSSPFLMIEPYDYAIVTAKERAALPADIAARFGLSISLFCQGIILSNGPQVDPGFRGSLFCLLFNTSSRPVVLKRGQHFATIEFERLMERTKPYAGKNQDKTSIIDYLPANTAVGALNELKVEVEKLQASNSTLQTFLVTTLSLTLALIAVLVAFK